MAKEQLNVYINAGLMRMVEEVKQATGATYTRIAGAALVRYLLGDLDHPDPAWMRMSIALDQGELTVSGIVVAIAREKIQQLDDERAAIVENAKSKKVKPPKESHALQVERGFYGRWIELVEDAEKVIGNPEASLDAVARALTKRPQRIKITSVPPPPGK